MEENRTNIKVGDYNNSYEKECIELLIDSDYSTQFMKDYTNLLKSTIKTIGLKTSETIHNPIKYVKFVDIKRHLNK